MTEANPEFDKDYWRNWVEEQNQAGVPLERLRKQLLDYPENEDFQISRAKLAAAKKIERVMEKRITDGKELEGNRRYLEAIELYEKNVNDEYPNLNSYMRLRWIYAECEDIVFQPKEAIRVCQAFLALSGTREEDREYFLDHLSKLQRYVDENC